jgi:hypothetical protein
MRKSLIGGTVAVTVFGIMVALLFAGCEISDADAQVSVQPVYVRPSKGGVLTVFTSAPALTTTRSDIYDWTGFDGAYFVWSCTADCTAASSYVEGSATAGGTYTMYPNSYRPFLNDGNGLAYANYNVGGFPKYIKFVVSTGGATTVSLSVIPIPYTTAQIGTGPVIEGGTIAAGNGVLGFAPLLIGGRSSGTNIVRMANFTSAGALSVDTSVSAASTTSIAPTVVSIDTTATGTTVLAALSTRCSAIIQNIAAVSITCGTGSVTSGGPGTVLKAATSSTTGDGGSMTVPNGSSVKCISSAGTVNVGVQPFACN